jgi:hypothetical protein
MIRAFCAWVFVVVGCGALAACSPIAATNQSSAEFSHTSTLFPYSDADTERLRKELDKPVQSTIELELGPKLVEVKASYTEQRSKDDVKNTAANLQPIKVTGRYFDLLASSSRFDGKLIGESELAYSGIPGAGQEHELPTMSRLTLRGNWGDANYGATYRSFGSGFVTTAGLKFDNPRDEREAWGEYDFKLFRLKGILGESWERELASGQLTLARTATTSLNLNRNGWSALLTSSYSLTGQNEVALDKTTAFSNGLSLAYRPTSFLTIEPAFNVKQEWSQSTGLKTATPSGGISLVSTLFPDVSLTGRTSYARGFSDDPLKDNSILNTAAGLNWKLGRTILGEQALSFQFEYNHQVSGTPVTTPISGFNGTIQWKLAGF